MAQLLDWLALTGARDSSGNPVASGLVYFYQPGGGSTQQNVYTDVNGTVIATQPVTLDAAGRAKIYVTNPVRVVVQTSTGSSVTDVDQANVTRAESVGIANAGFSSGYLDGALTALFTSTGGKDGQYLESSGATARPIQKKFSELSISVKDFGAKGDGLTIDTTAVQAAINRVAFLGGGEVYFPPGTYLIDQALTNSVNGVSFRGAGQKSIVKTTSTTLNLFTITAGSFYFRDLTLTGNATTTGTALAISGSSVFVSGLYIGASGIAIFRTCIALTTSKSGCSIDSCALLAADSDASARGLSITDYSQVALSNTTVYGGTTGQGIEFLGAAASFTATGCYFTTNYIKFNSALTGTGFRFVANGSDGPTSLFVFGASTIPKGFVNLANGVDQSATTSAVGAAQTPIIAGFNEIKLTAASGGAGTVTVNAPAVLPLSTTLDLYYDFIFVNAAAGAVTWTLNAVFKTASAIPTTDAHTIGVRFRWDGTALREVSRADTVT